MLSQETVKKIKKEFGYNFSIQMNWEQISKYKYLCENFIDKYANEVDWFRISKYQKLSEDFIEEHTDKIYWYLISMYQKLSEDFIDKYTNEVDWDYISRYQVITSKFAKSHNIRINNNSQKTAAEWKEMIEKTGLYECHEDYFYAYKNIRSDRYSNFNFQYRYLPGETYECFSDYSNDKNSFGLSAWTEKEAYNYSDHGMVVKLKINYADVTAIVHDSNKIRCKRITVLN